MKKIRSSIIMAVTTVLAVLPGISFANNILGEESPGVSDIKDSGCLSYTRASSSRSLVLKKEGDIVTCEINGIVANCGVDYFEVKPEYAQGKDAPDTLFFNVSPVIPSDMDCNCPYNVSFTIRNVTSDSFYLNCWMYMGMVSFKESNQITLEFSTQRVTIDGLDYILYKPGQLALLNRMPYGEKKGSEWYIPSTVSYEGQDYSVGAFNPDGFYGGEGIRKLILPNTIFRAGGDRGFYNCFNGRFPDLETIDVEQNSHLLSSVDGVLYSRDFKILYCLPVGNKRTEYTVIDGTEIIGRAAFALCLNLKSIRLPESVTTIRPYAFSNCENLESIYIHGLLNRDHLYEAFSSRSLTATLYVPESDVEFYKTIYKGPVLPISSSGETLGISNVNRSATNLSESYDLQGRRLSGKPAKGVYIENGRKRVK